MCYLMLMTVQWNSGIKQKEQFLPMTDWSAGTLTPTVIKFFLFMSPYVSLKKCSGYGSVHIQFFWRTQVCRSLSSLHDRHHLFIWLMLFQAVSMGLKWPSRSIRRTTRPSRRPATSVENTSVYLVPWLNVQLYTTKYMSKGHTIVIIKDFKK